MQPIVLHLRQADQVWGPDRHILQLARALPGRGYLLELAVLDISDARPGASNALLRAAEAAGLPARLLPARRMSLSRTVKCLFDWIRRRPIALLHSHEFKGQMIGACLSRIARVPHVTSDHGELTSMPRCYRIGLWSALGCARVIAGSQDRAGRLRVRGFRDDQIASCPFGFDPSELIPGVASSRGAWRAALGAADGDFVILCPARLDPQKDQATLIRALRDVIAQRRNVRLWLAGEGDADWRRGLVDCVRSFALDDHVTFLGYRDDVPDLMRACDLVALTSLEENFPHALLEAAYLARPILATRVGGVPELVQHGVNGWLVPPGSPSAVAAAILSILGDPAAAAERASAGRKLVEEQFHMSRVAARMAAIYASVLGTTPAD